MLKTDLRRKLAWLIGARAVISTVLLGGATVAQVAAPGSFAVDPLFLLIALTFGLTVVYALTLGLTERHIWIVDVQLALDALVVSAFIYVTGGINSVFASLYVLPIMAASTVRFRRGGLFVASLSAFIYAGLVTAQYLTVAGVMRDPWLDAVTLPLQREAEYRVALNLVGFFGVGLLSGSLAENARSTGARLKEASSEIADLQALNQHVIDSLPSGLATTDPEQRLLTFNRAAEKITGLSAESVIGRSLTEVLRMPPSLVTTLSEGLRGKGVRRLEFRFVSDGRRSIDIGLSATHLETPGGRAGILVTFQDLTDIKRREHDAQVQQRLAAVGEMAAGIAHEIRNPLASMSGSIQILRQELPLTTEQEQLMDIVLRESDRLNGTIRSFLAYARPQRFAKERLDLRRALRDTALLLRNSTEVGEGHVIDLELPDHELWFDADEGQMKQIVWNLATNGLRAMPDGGRLCLKASLTSAAAWSSGGGLVIAVTDDGIGMPAEAIDGLFQPFHGSFTKGSGLGLAIVHRIVTDYEGEIQVSSKPGAGTTVSVRLPVLVEVTT